MNLVYSPRSLEHLVAENYPAACLDRPARLEKVKQLPFFQEGLERLNESLSDERVIPALNGEQHLGLVHTPSYITQIKRVCEELRDGEIISLHENRDTWFSRNSYQAACYAVGGAVQAASLAKWGKNAFSLARPPGHHAHPDKEGGFCLFNNVAIAAEYLRRQGEKVFILDIDLHLGDGTLKYAGGKESLYYFSINLEHSWPHGEPEQQPNTKNMQSNVQNIFLPSGTDDRRYTEVLQDCLRPTLAAFHPSIIAVSAGFDTHHLDAEAFTEELEGGFRLTSNSYCELKKILDDSRIPYFCVLEGGYHPQSVLEGVRSFLES